MDKTNTITQDTARDGKPQKTTGEKWFGRMRFGIGEGTILVLTAVMAYLSTYGKDKWGAVPNLLKWIPNKIKNTLLENPLFALNKYEKGTRIAEAAGSATVLFWGGAFFAPVMKWLQDAKGHIVDSVNRKHSKPGELEAGQENLKREPKQTWGDVIKGRIGAWLLVFTSFVGADMFIGKDKNTLRNSKPMYWSDKFEDRFGRWIAGFTRGGKEIAGVPIGEGLNAAQLENKTYRFGKILALDIYATTAALLLWFSISKFSASRRKKAALPLMDEAGATLIQNTTQPPDEPAAETPKRSYADDERNQLKESHRARRDEERNSTTDPNMAMV